MLVTNQRLDKLAAARIDFKNRGMLNGTCLSAALQASCELNVHCYIKSQACLSALVAIQQRDSHEINEPDANQPNESNMTDSSIGATEQADNENVEIDDGPTVVEAHVELAKTVRKDDFIFCIECFSNGQHNAQNANAHAQYPSSPQNSHLHHSPSSFADSYSNNSPQMIRALLPIFHLQNVLGLMERFKSSILHLQHSTHLATAVELAVCAESISELVLFGETKVPETTVFLSIQMQVSRGWRAWT
jgi:hypothetical protein